MEENKIPGNRCTAVPVRKGTVLVRSELWYTYTTPSHFQRNNIYQEQIYAIQGASLRGRLPPPATLVHKEEWNKMRMNEADRVVHDFRCKLTTCKCQELHAPRKQPGRRMHVRNTYTYSKDGEKEQCCILMRLEIQANPLRITPA